MFFSTLYFFFSKPRSFSVVGRQKKILEYFMRSNYIQVDLASLPQRHFWKWRVRLPIGAETSIFEKSKEEEGKNFPTWP